MDGLESCREWQKWWMKGFTKVFSNGLAILKEWEMIGLLKWYMWDSVWVVVY